MVFFFFFFSSFLLSLFLCFKPLLCQGMLARETPHLLRVVSQIDSDVFTWQLADSKLEIKGRGKDHSVRICGLTLLCEYRVRLTATHGNKFYLFAATKRDRQQGFSHVEMAGFDPTSNDEKWIAFSRSLQRMFGETPVLAK